MTATRHDIHRTITSKQPSLDELIEARVAGYVIDIIGPLNARIDELRSEIEQLSPYRYPAMMTRSAAAEYCGISGAKLDWLARQGIVPARIPDGLEHRHYLRSDLDAWMRDEGTAS